MLLNIFYGIKQSIHALFDTKNIVQTTLKNSTTTKILYLK